MPSEEIQQPDTAPQQAEAPTESAVEEAADNEEQDYVHIEWAGYI
ncbi:hypothetical protein [Cohnella kolymensis]|nr:hypothetical protein [Cohnella kolymensis]